MVLGRQGPLAKMLNSGIGITREYQADRKTRNAERREDDAGLVDRPDASASSSAPGPKQATEDHQELEDNESWAQDLDAMQEDEPPSYTDAAPKPKTIEDIIANFMRRHPQPVESVHTAGLEQPVIIPSRRPGMRTRGFLRAYAPILNDVGIDQQTWLEFLDGFELSIKINPWFHTINVAVFVADKIRLAVQGFSLIAKAVFTAVHLSVEIGRRGYVHSKQNHYLDIMNEKFFQARGLYCMVIKYKPSSDAVFETTDLNNNIAEQADKRQAQEGEKFKNIFRSSAGTARHEDDIPEVAPLVFPSLDNMEEEQKKNAVKRGGAFLADYFDRQARAKFDMEHPESKLSVAPQSEWHSRYSDPNNPVSKGGLLSTISGGYLDSPIAMLRKGGHSPSKRMGIGKDPNEMREQRKAKKEKRPMKRLLKQDALYIMVVNMPSKDEINMMEAELNEASVSP